MKLIQLYQHNNDPTWFVHMGMNYGKYAVYAQQEYTSIKIFKCEGGEYLNALKYLTSVFTTKVKPNDIN